MSCVYTGTMTNRGLNQACGSTRGGSTSAGIHEFVLFHLFTPEGNTKQETSPCLRIMDAQSSIHAHVCLKEVWIALSVSTPSLCSSDSRRMPSLSPGAEGWIPFTLLGTVSSRSAFPAWGHAFFLGSHVTLGWQGHNCLCYFSKRRWIVSVFKKARWTFGPPLSSQPMFDWGNDKTAQNILCIWTQQAPIHTLCDMPSERVWMFCLWDPLISSCFPH